MASGESRIDLGGAAAKSVEGLREPLLPLYPNNSQDPGGVSSAGKLSHQQHHHHHKSSVTKTVTRSTSMPLVRVSRSNDHHVNNGEPFVFRGLTNAEVAEPIIVPAHSPQMIAEEDQLSEISEADSPQEEIIREMCTSPMCRSPRSPIMSDRESFSDDKNHHHRAESSSEAEDDSESLLNLKMEAMTWAAMAKDFTISSLEKRLRNALEIAKAEQETNQELTKLLLESREREETIAQELRSAKVQIAELAEAEERLCVELGNVEVEAGEEDRRYRAQIFTLTERIKAQDYFISHSLKTLKSGRPVQVYVRDESMKLQTDLSNSQDNEQSLATKLDIALREIVVLKGNLNDTKTDLRVSEVLRRSLCRRLKMLEKERRYLMRKGAIRTVRLAPRFHKKNDSDAPGGDGWKVFSILGFET